MRSALLALATSLALLLLAPVGTSQDLTESIQWTFTLEEEGRGDDDGLTERLLARIVSEPDSPAAELWAIRAIRARGGVRYPAELAQRMQAALDATEPVNGFAATWLRQWLVSYFAETGRWEQLEAARNRDGRLTSWLTLGPLGFPAADLSDHRFPPEWEIDLEATYAGIRGDVRWRTAQVDGDSGLVDLFAGATPILGASYGLSHFQIDDSRPVLLRFQCETSCTVWLNGEMLTTVDRRLDEGPAIRWLPAVLGSGWNRILIKIASPRSRGFSLRVADDRGRPIAIEEWDVEGEERVLREMSTPAEEAIPLPRPLDLRTRLLEGDETSPYIDLALALLATRTGDRLTELNSGESAADALEESPAVQSSFGELLLANGRVPRDWRRNRSRQRFERALELDESWVPALVELAQYLQQDDKSEEALAMIDRALAVNPESFPAWQIRLAIFQQRGWEKEQLDVLETLDRIAPDHPSVAMAWSRYWDAKGNGNRRRGALRRATASSEEHEAWLSAEALRLRQDGDYAAALATLERLEAHRPESRSTRRARAETLAAADRLDESIEIYRQLVEEDPDSAPTLNTLADLLFRADRDGEAIAIWERSLEVQPDQHAVRGLVREIGGEPDPYAPWELDVRDALARSPGRERYPEADSILILDQAVTRVFPDGSSETEIHQLRKLLTERGVESQSVQNLPGDVREVRTLLPDGRVLEPIRVSGQPGQFTMPGLAPGVTIETRFVYTTAGSFEAPVRVPAFYFQDTDYREPFIFSQQVIIHPTSLELPYVLHNEPTPQVIRQETGDEIVLTFLAEDMDLIQQEPGMPDADDVVPFVEAGQSASWDLIHAIYRDAAFNGTQPTPRIRSKALELIGDAADLETKLRRLYAGVQDWVVAPRGPADALGVLLTRRGSAINLYTAMLRALEIEFDVVRARPKPPFSRRKDWDFVDPDVFPFSVLRVPIPGREDVWLASVTSGIPFGLLPTLMDEATGYTVGPQAGKLQTLPRRPRAQLISQQLELDLKLGEDGTARGEGRFSLPAFEGYRLKDQVRNVEESMQRRLALSVINQVLPGARVTDFEFVGLEDPELPFALRFEAELRGLVRGDRVGTGLRPIDLTSQFVTRAERVHPVVLGVPTIQIDRIRIDPGTAFRFADIPRSSITELATGHYGIAYELGADGVLELERTLELAPGEVSPGVYPEFAKLCRQIDAAERQRVGIVPR